MEFNLRYTTSASLFTMLGSTQLDIRVIDIETGAIVVTAGLGGSELTLESIHKTVLDQIKVKLTDLKINGVILPSVDQLKEGETIILSPDKPLPGSNISSDLGSLTPGSILETEINKPVSTSNIPTGETVLSREAVKPTAGESIANLKSLPIENSIEVPKTLEPKSAEAEVKSTPIPTVKPEPFETVKIVTVPIEVERPAPLAATVATSGNVAQAAVSPISTTNISSTTINQIGQALATATEKEITNAISNNTSSTSKNTETANSSSKNTEVSKNSASSIITQGSTLLKELISNKETSQKSTIEKATSPEDLILSSFGSADFKEGLIKEGVKFDSADKILSAANEKKEAVSDAVNSAKSKVASEVASVKSSKLADSNSVKQLLTPDKTLEKSVSKLTRELPESINNLSSSFSTFSPQSSSTTNVTNEGTKIDQSSTVNSMQSANRQAAQADASAQPATAQSGMNQSEFYMQAIYAALMSGKIRVKIEQV